MITGFGDKATEALYHGSGGKDVRRFPPDIHKAALRKLDMLNGAQNLEDLRSPPNNRLEALKGDWAGFYSIRVNSQWRIVFRWSGNHSQDVRLLDYH